MGPRAVTTVEAGAEEALVQPGADPSAKRDVNTLVEQPLVDPITPDLVERALKVDKQKSTALVSLLAVAESLRKQGDVFRSRALVAKAGLIEKELATRFEVMTEPGLKDAFDQLTEVAGETDGAVAAGQLGVFGGLQEGNHNAFAPHGRDFNRLVAEHGEKADDFKSVRT